MAEIDTALLAEQADYYRARAGEYDEWWQRLGRYDHGPDATERWNAEVAEVEAALAEAKLSGDILELACGTGWWTERLARRARSLTCVDASPEVIALNRARLTAAELPSPSYEVADIFAWEPVRGFDAVFFSFWLSHVPDSRFERFWAMVARALEPGGSACFIDSVLAEDSGPRRRELPDDDGVQARRLNDGRSFRVIKRYHDPAGLGRRLDLLGWDAALSRTSRYFIHGRARRR